MSLQLFPDLDDATEAALRASIARFGVLVPVIRDQDGRTIDGHHRSRIAAEIGVECPIEVRLVADEDEARELARTLNADRRHLTTDQRREVVAALRSEGHSLRAIAGAVGVSDGQIRKDLADTGAYQYAPAVVTGRDGKSYPAARPAFGDKWQPSPALMSSESAEWYTPRHIVAAVVGALGAIDLDPCADPERTIPAAVHFTEQDDGLAHPWRGRVYMNPPYGRPIVAWTERLAREYREGRVTAAVALVPARTETDWWAVLDAQLVCLVHGRLAFSGHETSAPFPSAAIYLGPDGEQFARAFDAIGEVYRRVRL